MVSQISEKEIEFISLHSSPDNPIVIVPHDNPDVDALVSAELLRRALERENIASCICLRTHPDELTKSLIADNGLFCPQEQDIIHELPSGASVILVDWFAIPDKPENINIVAVFDHHPSACDVTGELVYEEHYSSTAKLIYDLFVADDDAIPQDELCDIVRSVAYTIFIDTNAMKSTSKYNPEDTPWLDEMIDRYSLDREKLVDAGLSLNDMTRPVDELVRNGEKQYVLPNGKKARIAYILTKDFDRTTEPLFAMPTMRLLLEGFDFSWFIVGDLGNDITYVFKSYIEKDAESADLWGDWFVYKGNLSRSADVYPMLEKESLARDILAKKQQR